jgi:hypothetical protein
MDAVMEVEIGPASEAGHFTVRVVRSVGAGEPVSTCELDVERLLAERPRLEDSILASSVAARRVMPAHETSVESVGSLLFDRVFAGPVREAYRTSVAVAESRGSGVRLLLRFAAPGLAALPWETLYDRETRSYLCRKEPLLRQIGTAPSSPALMLDPPLRVLALIASPKNLPQLDVEGERARLLEALGDEIAAGSIHVEWIVDARWHSVHEKLLDDSWHVVHFIGHGSFDPQGDEGVLAFVGPDGRADFHNASSFADLLHEAVPTPRLVVLNACLTGAESADDLFSGTAAALVHSGINAVAAMQFAISDQAAIEFTRGFYMSLARGRTIDDAMRSGRIGILGVSRDTLEWVTPILCVRGDDTRLFDVNARAAQAGSKPDPTPSGATAEAVAGEVATVAPGLETAVPAAETLTPATEPVTQGADRPATSADPARARDTAPPPAHPGSTGARPDDGGRHRRRVATLIGALAVLVVGAAIAIAVLRPFDRTNPGPTGSSGTQGASATVIETKPVVVAGNQPWTDTGVSCASGDSMRIQASGTVYHNSSRSSAVGPDGLTDPRYHQYNVDGLPDANTASLIGSLDKQQPFFVGTEKTFVCDRAGRLFLGINDRNLDTNSGQWAATVTRSTGPS